jgi:hypothetical protein
MAKPENSSVEIKAAMGRMLVKFRDTVCVKYAAEAEQIAKENAPWTDQTGDARKKLKGKVIDDGEALGFELLHRVEYGPYLERDGDGEYSILKPTVEGLRAGFFKAARVAFGGKG